MAIIFVPSIDLIGPGVMAEMGAPIKELDYKKTFLVADHFLGVK